MCLGPGFASTALQNCSNLDVGLSGSAAKRLVSADFPAFAQSEHLRSTQVFGFLHDSPLRASSTTTQPLFRLQREQSHKWYTFLFLSDGCRFQSGRLSQPGGPEQDE